MAVIQNPALTVTAEVDATYKAQRMSVWPVDALGAYRVAAFTGLLSGLAANTEIFQMRWTDNAKLAIIKYLRVRYAVITGFTAAQELAFDAVQAASWTAVGSGGTALTPSVTNMVRRSTYPVSVVNDMRIAAAAALTAGTKTLYGNPILTGVKKTLAAAATVQDADFESALDLTSTFDDPIVLQQNEGLAVRNIIALGAGGTVRASVELGWTEMNVADYPTL